jgi:hypothetical protein
MKPRHTIVALVFAATLSACGDDMTTPITPSPGPGPGPIVNNTPPVIGKFTVQGTRTNEPPSFADASEEVPVSVEVTDAESAISDLKFNWAASFGTFSGSGPKVIWKAPASVVTPTTVTLNLEVVETYTSQGQQVTNKPTGSTTLSLHDSVKEVGDLASLFLKDFSDSTIPVRVVMRNFQPDCYGTADETGDVTANRANFTIVQSRVESPATTVSFGGLCPYRDNKRGDACAQVRTFWKSIAKVNLPGLNAGDTTYASGVDQVAAMYYKDQQQWRLCDSQFKGDDPPQTSLIGLLRGLVP